IRMSNNATIWTGPVYVTYDPASVTAVGDAPARGELQMAVGPNPTFGQVTASFSLPQPVRDADLAIFDASGRRVRTLLDGPSAALVLLLLFPISARAAGNVHATLIDSTTSAPVAGASVRFTSLSDSTQVFTAFTGDDGSFTLLGLSPGQFRIEFARMGYAIYR